MLRRTRARSIATGFKSAVVTVGAGALIVETGNNQPSDGAQVLTISVTSSPCCHASVPPTPIRTTRKKRASLRVSRLPIDGLSLLN